MPSGAGIVVSKSIDIKIPEWLKSIYKHGLGKRNPNVIHDKITALKVMALHALGSRDGANGEPVSNS